MYVAVDGRLLVPELAPERVRDIYAHALGAVERAGQRFALVPDARVLFGIFWVESETRLVHDVRTIVQY